VTEQADKKCRQAIHKLVKQHPGAFVVVTGCYAQLKPEQVASIPGVDLVLGMDKKGSLLDYLTSLDKREQGEMVTIPTKDIRTFVPSCSQGDRTRFFLKVQDGCDYCCAYCTIHYARGSSRNMPIADLVEEARQIAAGGQKEIVITGVNTGDFGRTTGESFLDLLKALNEVEGIERYRISSIEPNLLTDEIIAFCASSPKFQHHFHIPLQSGSDRILQSMGRRYTSARFADRIAKVKELMPDAFIGIDVIVGFPGEKEEHFLETYHLLEQVKPAFLHIFPFSERPGTPAVNLPEKVQSSVATERVERLEELSRRLHGDFCRAGVGQVQEVLFESTLRGGMMTGFTGNYRRVKVPYRRQYINQIVPVRLLEMDEQHDLAGEILE
jgi:threonylcarbamoyladenosine tRNA methylthiotransferase MtaB